MDQKIILASTSPRRAQLLKHLNLKFRAVDPGYEEVHHRHLKPEALVKYLALGKARSAALRHKNALIIAADTLVAYEGEVLGKPHTADTARRMLRKLSGKKHQILTGVAIVDARTGQVYSACDAAGIKFKKLTPARIAAYVASGEPLDRAGAYAIQGLGYNLIKRLEGDLTTAIGLPMSLVYNGLKNFGVKSV